MLSIRRGVLRLQHKLKLPDKRLGYTTQEVYKSNIVTWHTQRIISTTSGQLNKHRNKRKNLLKSSVKDDQISASQGNLSIAAKMLMQERPTADKCSSTKDEDSTYVNFDVLDDLLKTTQAMDMPGTDFILQSKVSDTDVTEYLAQQHIAKSESFGSEESYVEHLSGVKTTEQSSDQDHSSIYLFGSPDPSIPLSQTPCAGCGAILHCQDTGIPGYMPSQKFVAVPKKELRNQICQRCFMLEEHEVALNVSVDPVEYLEIVGQIKKKRALVVLVVDVMDLPNSIFKDLIQLVGKDRPMYVIGSKVDLLPKDSDGYLQRTKETIMKYMHEYGFAKHNHIKHVSLVSAKTGYNIENFVTTLMNEWHRRGDVYVVGCTNVGKSTLFNSLLSSDYCKGSARDFIHRATVSNWPGTTLNTLKFPVVNPAAWRLKQRADRLLKDREEEVEEERLRLTKLKHSGNLNYATLMGHIGQTFVGNKEKNQTEQEYMGYSEATYTMDQQTGVLNEYRSRELENLRKEVKEKVETYNESIYAKSLWCYDTPGVVNSEQIINLLTQQELTVMLTKRLIQPRTFIVQPGCTVFVSGLGRIDYVKGVDSIYCTVLCSIQLPVHVIDSCTADEFYQEHIGTETLGVPLGDCNRLNRLPSLVGRKFDMIGIGWHESVADILLSSLGWVSVTAGGGMEVSLRAYTPGGYGCKLRQPALLCHAINLKGKRIRGTRGYKMRKPLG